jgi:hypothetical protein
MNNKDEFNQFSLKKKLDRGEVSNEISASQKRPEPERIPSGYDPMGQIQLEGRAYRSLAGGRIPWWVLITGWTIFGSIASLFIFAIISSFSLTALFPLVIAIIPLLILWKGTVAKLSRKNSK